MFLNNKYSTWYFSIIETAKSRTLDGYQERHHIVPRSLGGSNDKSNIVKLTAKEHYICHWLLTKMTTGKQKSKMIHGLFKMCVSSNNQKRHVIPARLYEKTRREISEISKGSGNPIQGPRSEETRANISKGIRRSLLTRDPYRHTEETKRKIALGRQGHKHSEATKKHLSKLRKGKCGGDLNSGKHWYNDGNKSYLRYTCPEGCVPGRL